MNTTAAAAQANVTVATIRTWCARGVVAAVKQAGRWVIDTASLSRRIAIGKLKKGTPAVNGEHAELIRLCETQAAICTNRLQELNRRGQQNLNCTPAQFKEMIGSYTRAASTYTYLAQALKDGNRDTYRTLTIDARTAHAGAFIYDQDITGEELPKVPRRREMALPKA